MKQITFEHSLADSSLVEFRMDSESLCVTVRLWNGRTGVLSFSGVVGLIYNGESEIAGLALLDDITFLAGIAPKLMEPAAKKDYQVFGLIGNDDDVILRVVAKTVTLLEKGAS